MKGVKKHRCCYCGNKTSNKYMCGRCKEKLVFVRKLLKVLEPYKKKDGD